MIFAHPNVLWGLLLLPLLALYEIRWGAGAKARLRLSSLDLLPAGLGTAVDGPSRILAGLRLGALAFAFVALARPQRGQERQEVTSPATDIVLCLDVSDSMRSLDFKPKNRLDAALEVIKEFVKHRSADRIGLVLFANGAFTQCPLTLDHGALMGFLDNVGIGVVDPQRTAVGTAIATAVGRLKKSEAKSKVIVLLTDGQSNAGEVDPPTAARAAAAFGIKIYTVGAGAPGGGLIEVDDPFFGKRLVRTPENELDEATLRRVAEDTHGVYFRATDLASLKKIYGEIDRMEKTDVKTQTFAEYRDVYPVWLWGAFLLLAAEGILSQTLWRRYP